MSETKKYLFVGGPVDGQVIPVETCYDRYLMPEIDEVPAFDDREEGDPRKKVFEDIVYVKQKILAHRNGRDEYFYIMRHGDGKLTPEEFNTLAGYFNMIQLSSPVP